MTPPPHRIRRLTWRVRAPSVERALATRAEVRAAVDGSLREALSRALDDLVPPGVVVHLDRLDISARGGSVEEILAELPALVRRAVQDRLSAPTAVSLSPAAREAAPGAENPMLAAPLTLAERRVAALAHYLQTGALPWSMETWDRAEAAAFFGSVTLAEALAALAVGPPTGIDAAARAQVVRALQLLPAESWPPVARALAPPGLAESGSARLDEASAGAALGAGGNALGTAILAIAQAPSLGRHAALTLAATLILEARSAAPVGVVRSLLAAAPGNATMETANLADVPEPARTLLRRLLVADAAPPPPPDMPAQPRSPPPREPESPAPRRPTTPAPRAANAPFGQVVGAAGLVLLHPFLPRFFDTVGVERASPRALAEAALPRAAALLHLVATGEDEPTEHELGLVKVLLGLAPEDPLPVAAGLVTTADRAEADAMLAAVLVHWGALGRTGIDALRGTFLDRRGLLRPGAGRFRIEIEQGPYDVLLHKLPWGFSVIKLPWMTRPIFAEWPLP